MNTYVLKKPPYLEALFLVLITGLVYLPYVPRLTYWLDDWYFIYDGVVAGPNIFHPMLSIDRPLRGYLFDFYFSLFGPNPLPYHLGVYLWHLFAGLCTLWLFRSIWTENRWFVFLIALLFILYPGYTWWVSAFDYQPVIVSLGLQAFSCVMTLEAIQSPRYSLKVLFIVSAILSGWVCIALVEYAIGMEFFRFWCVYLLISRKEQSLPLSKRIFISIRTWAWNLLIPVGFIIWKLFFFENQRKTTDINLMINKFQSAPIDTLWRWAENMSTSFMNVGVHAWYKQFLQNFTHAGFQKSYTEEIILAMGILALLGVAKFYLSESTYMDENRMWKKTSAEAAFLGFTSLCFGIFPVVFANRYVNLSFYSHYGLPASLAATVLLVGLISYLVSFKHLWSLIISIVVVIAGVTHSLLAQKTIILENSLQNFWWQVSWRIPDLRPDTTIVTLYPFDQVVDNELGLPYPVNLIYFPEKQTQIPIRLPVSTLMPTDNNIILILDSAQKKTNQYRVHKTIINYSNILILVQPTPLSCVRVIGAENYIFSANDPQNIKTIASYSKIENIRLGANHHLPPEFAFGAEPNHAWCYFFEKADLAVQKQDWEEASQLGNEVLRLGLLPSDSIEWYPFIRAYARTGAIEKLEIIALHTAEDDYFQDQVCNLLRDDTSINPHTHTLVYKLYCD